LTTLKRLKTLLLGLALILITFTIFVALPSQLPSFGSLSCEKVMWACSQRGMPPVIYDTWMWHTSEQPDSKTLDETRLSVVVSDDILNGLRKATILSGIGNLNIVVDPENEDRIIVSGYLQYGFYIHSENETDIIPLIPIPEMKGLLRSRTIKVRLFNTYENNRRVTEQEVTTDRKGFFTVTLEPDAKASCYRIETKYGGETVIPSSLEKPIEYYFPCIEAYTTCFEDFEFTEPKTPWWVWLIIGLAVVITAFLLYWYLKRRRKYISGDMEQLPPAEEIETPEVPEKKEDDTGGDIIRIEISFPDIEESLPSVWGVGESLTVRIDLKDRNGNNIPSQSCDIDWGDGESVLGISGEDGRIRLEHVFTIKGEYVINATYTDSGTGKELSSWRRIRIVDYREEMVHLFSEMLETLNIRDIKIDPKMTAREAEVLLTERLERVSVETIRKVVAGFEEANYSIHHVSRDSYVTMYLAVSEVLGYGG